MQKLEGFCFRKHISVPAGMRTFLTSMKSNMKMGLVLKNCDQVTPDLSTLCLEGNERWDTELRLKRSFDIMWDIEITTFLGGHVKHNLLDLKLWIVKITGGS